MPILGAILYFLLGNKKTGKKLKQKLTKASGELKSQNILKTLKADYMATLEECREVTLDSLNRGKMHRSVNGLLRVAAPLL